MILFNALDPVTWVLFLLHLTDEETETQFKQVVELQLESRQVIPNPSSVSVNIWVHNIDGF